MLVWLYPFDRFLISCLRGTEEGDEIDQGGAEEFGAPEREAVPLRGRREEEFEEGAAAIKRRS